MKEEIVAHSDELLAKLVTCKTDKSQPVRSAAQETIKLIKDLQATTKRDSADMEVGAGIVLQRALVNQDADTDLSFEASKPTAMTKV